MMEETKTFSLRTVLTVVTGRLLTERKGPRDNGISDRYKLLEWMAMDSPYTHSLERFADECKPHLFRLFPELGLACASLDSLDAWLERSPACPEEGVRMWLAELKMLFPQIRDEYAIPQFPLDHVIKDPVEELREMARILK